VKGGDLEDVHLGKALSARSSLASNCSDVKQFVEDIDFRFYVFYDVNSGSSWFIQPLLARGSPIVELMPSKVQDRFGLRLPQVGDTYLFAHPFGNIRSGVKKIIV